MDVHTKGSVDLQIIYCLGFEIKFLYYNLSIIIMTGPAGERIQPGSKRYRIPEGIDSDVISQKGKLS